VTELRRLIFFYITLVISVHLAACQRVPTGRNSVKYDTGDFYEKSVEKIQIWLKSGKQYRALCMKKYVLFIVAGDIKSTLKHSLQVN